MARPREKRLIHPSDLEHESRETQGPLCARLSPMRPPEFCTRPDCMANMQVRTLRIPFPQPS